MSEQRTLFPGLEEPRRGPVGPASVAPEVAALAARLPAGLRLGTSSWSFPGWQGLVYDRPASEQELARTGLAAYAQHPLLRAVGVDRSYYQPLRAATWAAYAAVVPPGFRFLAKAWDRTTDPQGPGFLDPQLATQEVVGPAVEGLGERLGALLFQLPPLDLRALAGPGKLAERIYAFLSALPPGPRYALEVRSRGLVGPALAEALRAAGVSPCLSAHPQVPLLPEQAALLAPAVERGPLVMRWMLHRRHTYQDARERYAPFDRLVDEDPETRADLAGLAGAALRAGREVLITINNKAEGSSPCSLLRLAEAIADAR